METSNRHYHHDKYLLWPSYLLYLYNFANLHWICTPKHVGPISYFIELCTDNGIETEFYDADTGKFTLIVSPELHTWLTCKYS